MKNSKTDLDSPSSHSSTEVQFLQQVKECQHHLQCIEKLFFESLKVAENDKQLRSSHISLDEINKSSERKHKLSNSFPDLQLLLQEFETKFNNTCNGGESVRSQKEEPLNIQLQSVNNDDNLSTLTFVVQVPNSILDIVKKKSSNLVLNCSTKSCTKQMLRTQKKTQSTSWLQKLFKRKRNTSSKKNELLKSQSTNTKYDCSSNSSQNSNTSEIDYDSLIKNSNLFNKHNINENLTNTETASISNSLKEGPTLVFPIIYNFDEKLPKTFNSNLTIQQDIKPKSNASAHSHSMKVLKEVPLLIQNKISNEFENKTVHLKDDSRKSLKEKSEVTEMLLESLIKSLLKTTEKFDDLEKLKSLVEIVSEKEIKTKKSHHCCKNMRTKDSKEQKVLNHFLQHIMEDIENKINDSKIVRSKKKNMQQISKKQSSKTSVCSSDSVSSNEKLNRNSVILKPKHIQRHSRCHSPSMLNYLVCQSERDID